MFRHGFMIGKFQPLHKGHTYTIDRMIEQCEKSTIVVCSNKDFIISGVKRYNWVKEKYACYDNVDVVHLTWDLPNYPHEHPLFWDMWTKALTTLLSANIDVVFGSDSYINDIAKYMGIEGIIVDLERVKVPTSGTSIMSNPYKNWKYIEDPCKPYFVKKIAIVGPESSGKTTLTKNLSDYYDCFFVKEYGRTYVEETKLTELTHQDFNNIASRQIEEETQAVKIAATTNSKMIVCDTELITTQIFAEMYCGFCPEWIIDYNTNQKYSLYLLMKPDLDWDDDGVRLFTDVQKHYERIKTELLSRNILFEEIGGRGEERIKNAIKAIDKYIVF